MPFLPLSVQRPALFLTAALSATLVACGGGGGSGSSVADTPVAAITPAATASSPSPSATAVETPTVAADTALSQALSAAASFAVEGIAGAPPVATDTTATTGRRFYINSRTGSDSNDGLADTAAAGHGPWQSLGRLATSGLAPGDTVQLACGSEWAETLKVPVSGTSALPIAVRAPSGGCTLPPVIDGSVELPSASWSLHSGNVYKINLNATPLQLLSTTASATTSVTAAQWSQAHHPNRGYLTSDRTSPYLTTAGDSDNTTVGNQQTSSYLVSGSDLVLPAGASLVGAEVRVRTYPWWMDTSTIASVVGNRLNLNKLTAYPVGAGWGYYFTNKLWMVDSPGEWYYDPTAKQLYAYMPEGVTTATPTRAAVLAAGIDLKARSFVVVDGLAVRRTATGVDLRGTTSVTVRNSTFQDIRDFGADATASVSTTVESNAFTRIGLDAISGWRHELGWSIGLKANNNVIRDSGVLMDGEAVLSLPRMALAAILGGESSTVSGNTILNSGYIGILVKKSSLVEKNFVYGACTVLDDCAGIFLQFGDNNGVVRGNTVVHSRGAPQGKAPAYALSQAQGIYLDESASGVLVENNTVIDADNGIFLHEASHNTVRGNQLYANRRSQIWLQATRNIENAAGDVVGNTIFGNQIAPVYPGSVGLWLASAFASTAAFGSIDGNRYFDRATPIAVLQSTSAGARAYTFGAWQRSTATDMPTGRDANGRATSNTGFAGYSVAGASVVPNGNLANSSGGWNAWNATAPAGQLVREACPAGTCLRYLAGGSPGLISAPNFSIKSGQWYRLTVDISTEQDNQTVNLVVRRGGGGANGYEGVIDRDLSIQASRAWKRYSMVFLGTVNVNAQDPLTGDLGARVDFEPVSAGKTLSIASLELVPLTPDSTAQMSGTFINASSSARSWACPYSTTQPALCAKFRGLTDDAVVTWPVTVAPRSAAILYAQEPTLIDSDGDGIPDGQDLCPVTPAGAAVDAKGCPLTLR